MKKIFTIVIPLAIMLFSLTLIGCGKKSIDGYYKDDNTQMLIKIENDTIYMPDITYSTKGYIPTPKCNGMKEIKLEYNKNVKAYHDTSTMDSITYYEIKDDGKLHSYYLVPIINEQDEIATYSKVTEEEWNEFTSELDELESYEEEMQKTMNDALDNLVKDAWNIE